MKSALNQLQKSETIYRRYDIAPTRLHVEINKKTRSNDYELTCVFVFDDRQ